MAGLFHLSAMAVGVVVNCLISGDLCGRGAGPEIYQVGDPGEDVHAVGSSEHIGIICVGGDHSICEGFLCFCFCF